MCIRDRLAIISGQRVQTLCAITIGNIQKEGNSTRIFVPKLLKTSKPNVSQPCIFIPKLNRNKKLCVKSALEIYLDKTKEIRSSENLFVSTISPYKNVSCQTLSRWLVKLLELAKINVSVYKS